MRARSALKLSLTLSRSSGCVQQAAPQEASPPKYQRDVRASAMVRAAATWPDPGEHHNSGIQPLDARFKVLPSARARCSQCARAAPGAGPMDSAHRRTPALGDSASGLKVAAARSRDGRSTGADRETAGAGPWPPPQIMALDSVPKALCHSQLIGRLLSYQHPLVLA